MYHLGDGQWARQRPQFDRDTVSPYRNNKNNLDIMPCRRIGVMAVSSLLPRGVIRFYDLYRRLCGPLSVCMWWRRKRILPFSEIETHLSILQNVSKKHDRDMENYLSLLVPVPTQWPRCLRRGPCTLDRGFESRLGYWCLSLYLYVVLSCVGRGLATSWSLVQVILPYVETD
jgi:hypothetical protein